MERNYEDKLMELAFGELNPEEAARLDARVEAEPLVARDLAFTRLMREDLLSLADDVPPDQLSKERLRQAILANGLHPAPLRRSLGLGWLWAPTAAFAAAFVFVFLRNQPAEPIVVADERAGSERSLEIRTPIVPPSTVAANDDAAAPIGIEDFQSGAAALRGMNLWSSPQTSPVTTTTVVEQSGRAIGLEESVSKVPSSPLDDMRTVVRGGPAMGVVTEAVGERPGGLDPEGTSAGLMAPGSSGDSTIVLIHADRSGTTGAQTAKELEKENVLVGG